MFPAPGQPSPRPRPALRLLPARGRSSSAQCRRDGGDTQLWGGRVQIATAKSVVHEPRILTHLRLRLMMSKLTQVRLSQTRSLIQPSTSRVELSKIFLLLLVTQYLVDEHAGEDADEDPDDGEAEHGAEAGVDGSVDDLAVGGGSEDVAKGGVVIQAAMVHDAGEAGAGLG